MNNKKCLNCNWWKCAGRDLYGKPYNFGRCHKNTPTVGFRTKDISRGYQDYSTVVTNGSYTFWPKTKDIDFCGEHSDVVQ